jgi:hypothetical protein
VYGRGWERAREIEWDKKVKKIKKKTATTKKQKIKTKTKTQRAQ